VLRVAPTVRRAAWVDAFPTGPDLLSQRLRHTSCASATGTSSGRGPLGRDRRRASASTRSASLGPRPLTIVPPSIRPTRSTTRLASATPSPARRGRLDPLGYSADLHRSAVTSLLGGVGLEANERAAGVLQLSSSTSPIPAKPQARRAYAVLYIHFDRGCRVGPPRLPLLARATTARRSARRPYGPISSFGCDRVRGAASNGLGQRGSAGSPRMTPEQPVAPLRSSSATCLFTVNRRRLRPVRADSTSSTGRVGRFPVPPSSTDPVQEAAAAPGPVRRGQRRVDVSARRQQKRPARHVVPVYPDTRLRARSPCRLMLAHPPSAIVSIVGGHNSAISAPIRVRRDHLRDVFLCSRATLIAPNSAHRGPCPPALHRASRGDARRACRRRSSNVRIATTRSTRAARSVPVSRRPSSPSLANVGLTTSTTRMLKLSCATRSRRPRRCLHGRTGCGPGHDGDQSSGGARPRERRNTRPPP